MTGKPNLNPPYQDSDKIPMIRNGKTYQVPADNLLTTTGPQSIENKTIDCSSGSGNTCLNFPGIPYSAIPECSDTSGQHLNFTNGAFSCGVSGGSGGGGGVGVALTADDGSTALTADDNSTPLTGS